mmetsp:Transcript_27547/g.49678  ORF Transcript_27547/g.49678 Transcript_27547/m.49678 type:complete len:537 (+) Transcript_27547:1157-2767(+)
MASINKGLQVRIAGERASTSRGLLSRKYIEYEIQLVAGQDLFTSFKRYREILAFKEKLEPSVQLTLPDFPSKSFLLTDSVLEKRKTKLESWLKALLDEHPAQLLDFMQVPSARINFLLQLSRNPELTEGDKLVADFMTRLHSEARLKCKALESFTTEYFKKVRPLHKEYIKLLVITLASLSACDVIGSKALDLLFRLASCTHSRQHLEFTEALLSLTPQQLQKLKLECHIKRTVHGGSCVYGLQILNLLDTKAESSDDERLLLILNGDSEALEEYKNWKDGSLRCHLKSIEASNDWITIDCPDNPGNFVLKFRFVERQLELQISEAIEAPLERIVDLICNPERRMLWDKMLIDFHIIDHEGDSTVSSFKYVREGSNYPVICTTDVQYRGNSATIRMKSMPDEEAERRGYEPGHNVMCVYTLEPLQTNSRRTYSVEVESRRPSSSDEDSGESIMEWYSLSVSAKFCVHLSKQLMPLVYQEDAILQHNMARLKCTAEGSFNLLECNDSLCDVLERKMPADLVRRKRHHRSKWSHSLLL